MGDLKRKELPLMLLGDRSAGKTSLILRLTGSILDDSKLNTVGNESYIHNVNLHGHNLKMKIWDTAGQERFKYMSVQVIKKSHAVVLVYAIDDRNSFNSLDQWLNKLNDTSNISRKPIIVIGNKSEVELEKRQVTYEEGKKFAEDKGFHFYETSAKTGQNVKEAFDDIFEQLYQCFESEIVGGNEVKKEIILMPHKINRGRKLYC